MFVLVYVTSLFLYLTSFVITLPFFDVTENTEETQLAKMQRTIQRLLNLSKAQHKKLKAQEASIEELRGTLTEIKSINNEQSAVIEKLIAKESGQVAANTRNLQRLRVIGMLMFCGLGVGSTIDYKPLQSTPTSNPFSVHGDRLSSLLTAVTGAGGAAALFFLKKNDKDSEQK